MTKHKILAFLAFFAIANLAQAQDKEEKKTKKITIITIDEDGKRKEITKEITTDESDIEWVSEGDDVRVVVRTDDGEEQEVIVHAPNIKVKVNKGAFLGVYLGSETNSGVAITGTSKGSGAREAGLKDGDIITAINGEDIRSTKELGKAIDANEPGDDIKVTYIRDGKTKTVTATLGTNSKSYSYNFDDWEDMDIKVEGINEFWVEETKRSSSKKGFLGVYPADEVDGIDGMMILNTVSGSAADDAGLQTGDVIVKIDDTKITDFDDLKVALKDKKPGDDIELSYKRQGKTIKKTVELGRR